MVVKDKRGRRRYIAFIVETMIEVSGEEIFDIIKKKFRLNNRLYIVKPRLVWFENNKGILRCSHIAKDEAIKVLNSISTIDIQIRTLKTSGTIKGAKQKFIKDFKIRV